jgi:multicomponent Na+:H+ antiporter subunit G
MTSAMFIEFARASLSGLIVAAGMFLMAGGAIGVLRFPDLYTRLHAARVADGAGAVIVVLGVAMAAPTVGITLKLILLDALIALVGPVLTHLTANTAHAAGLAPIAGPYVAPRPASARPSERKT